MNWKNILVQTLLLCLLAGPFLFGEDVPSDKSPSAFIPQDRFQFDPVAEGKEVVHDFTVQNRGDAPLVIEKVQTG